MLVENLSVSLEILIFALMRWCGNVGKLSQNAGKQIMLSAHGSSLNDVLKYFKSKEL